jgi:hypothetical protein
MGLGAPNLGDGFEAEEAGGGKRSGQAESHQVALDQVRNHQVLCSLLWVPLSCESLPSMALRWSTAFCVEGSSWSAGMAEEAGWRSRQGGGAGKQELSVESVHGGEQLDGLGGAVGGGLAGLLLDGLDQPTHLHGRQGLVARGGKAVPITKLEHIETAG